MKNQKGFVSLSLIFWTPVMLTTLLGTAWVLWFIQQKLRVDHLCDHYVLASQEALVRANNVIMGLNAKAWSLWAEKKALNQVIKTAPPPVKALALARRQVVIVQQTALRKVQQYQLRSGDFRSRTELFRLRKKFRDLNREWLRFWKDSQRALGRLQVTPRGSQLKVRIQDIAPIYQRKDGHEHTQSLHATWQVPLPRFLPSWLLGWVPTHQLWEGQCASHPHDSFGQWQARLGAGNH
jgi:hypothetical protein